MSIHNNHKDTIRIHTFPNHFRVIYQQPKPTQLLPITNINVFCKVGSIYETEQVRGVCHFVEHMCFKGTKKIIHPKEIFMNYDEIGAYINAYTEKEYTCYTLKCPDKYVEHSTHILADMMLNSTFPKKEFIKEQKVVVEENIRNMNDDEWVFFDKLNAIFYEGSSFAFPIDSITYHPNDDTLKYKDVVEWYKHFYDPGNMVMSIMSNIPFSEIIHVLTTSFFVKTKSNSCISIQKIETATIPSLNVLPLITPNSSLRIEIFKKKGVSTNFIGVGFRTCNKHHIDKYSLWLLSNILNGLSGRLFTLLREKHGLTYRSSTYTENKDHTGYFLIYAETDPHKTISYTSHNTNGKNKSKSKEEIGVLPIILKLIKDLVNKGITNEELKIFKGKMKGNYLMDLQTMDSITTYNGTKYILSSNITEFQHTFMDYNDIYDTFIDKITKEQMNQVIRQYFGVENRIIYILGETVPSISQVHGCIP